MARIKVAAIAEEVDQVLPEHRPDASRIGVNYADAFSRQLNNAHLEDGRVIGCKRRGLQLTLTIGERSAAALMDRYAGPEDPQSLVLQTLTKAASELGYRFSYENRTVYLEEA